MDSLTQIALGACVGGAIGGRKYGRKSILIGAIIGTTPDLDVFFSNYNNPIQSMTTHRGFSHSLLFTIFATPILAFIASRIKYLGVGIRDWQIYLLIFMGLFTHIILDAMTIYGTQIFWPSQISPVGIGSIFIIDLLYTLPLLIGLLWYLKTKSIKVIRAGLLISTIYLSWSVVAQQHVKQIVKDQISTDYSTILVQPTPFNTFLWRALILTDDHYKVGYYSIFDKEPVINFKTYSTDLKLKENLKNSYAVSRMNWFSKGMISVRQEGNAVVLSDLRMGLEPDQYAFQFIIAKEDGGEFKEVPNHRFNNKRDLSRLSTIWARIWDDNIDL